MVWSGGYGNAFGATDIYNGSKTWKVWITSDPNLLKRKIFGLNVEQYIYLSAILFVFLIWFLFQILDDFGIVLGLIGVPVLTWLFIYIFRNCTEKERNQTLVMLLLMAFSVFFWALFEQAASSITFLQTEM